MKRLALSLCLAGSLMAAGLQNRTSVRGSYLEARTADVYVGACFANSEAGLVGNLAVSVGTSMTARSKVLTSTDCRLSALSRPRARSEMFTPRACRQVAPDCG